MLGVPALGQLVETPDPAPVQLAQLTPTPAPTPGIQREAPVTRAGVMQSFAPVVQSAAPAVVNVFTSKQMAVCPYQDPFFAQFYCGASANRTERRETSLGSGVIVGSDGVIVTNNHVVADGDEFRVVLQDRREFEAKLVMKDERTDLAVLKIDVGNQKLPTLQFADTRGLQVGDLVLAIGDPFGVGQTVTNGIVSALARTDVGVSDYSSFIQTDASINPGNSGGALVDMQGRLVGVNSMIYSRNGESNGIGFAIPAEMVKRVVDAALHGGTLVPPWLGAQGDTVDSKIAQALGLDRPRGVLIGEVYPGGPAAKAGLKKGDIVLSVDGRQVFDEKGMKFVAATKAEGDTVSVETLRNGKERTLSVKLEAPPGASKPDLIQIDGRNPFAGAQVAELSPALADALGLDPVQFGGGMLIYSVPPRTIARGVGLQPGDIVKEVNGISVKTAADLKRALNQNAAQWRVAIERNGKRIEAVI
ncbi:MAG: Do family serine endopeptidase [Alphaproteobacteria bacterium]|nr:Do family serine endopeptidase [Alphaproteobacteria bacterium]